MEQLKEILTEIIPAFSSIFYLAGYVFSAIALFFIAKKLSLRGAPAAFFPIANIYLLGDVSNKCANMLGQENPKYKFWLLLSMWVLVAIVPMFAIFVTIYVVLVLGVLIFALFYAIGGTAPDINSSPELMERFGTLAVIVIVAYSVIRLFAFAFTVSKAFALNRIFTVAVPKQAILFTFLSLLPLADGIILFCIRNKVRIIEREPPKVADVCSPIPTTEESEEVQSSPTTKVVPVSTPAENTEKPGDNTDNTDNTNNE